MEIGIEDLQKYELYLNVIDKQLEMFFEEQAPYIFCKEGCSLCCEKGEYPFSELEIKYLMIGFSRLDKETQMKILQKASSIIEQKKKRLVKDKFLYQCPFLINHRCSVYNYRGLICRNHGLAFFDENKKLAVPHCASNGLNYSSVYDFDKESISKEKFEKTGFDVEPVAHNVGLGFLLNNSFTQKYGVNFGDVKSLIEWLE